MRKYMDIDGKRASLALRLSKALTLAALAIYPLIAQAQNAPVQLTPSELKALDETAKRALTIIQQRSIREGREFCGYIFKTENPDGSTGFETTKPVPGQWAGCMLPDQSTYTGTPIASFHTHSSFSFQADNEVPSVTDLRSDIQTRQIGYVSTPGGRFWRSNYPRGAILMICDKGCIFTDPGFEDDTSWGPMHKRYTLNELINRQGE